MELASKGVRNWCWQVNKSLVCLQLPSMLINQGQYTACSSTQNFIKIALMETANSKWHNLLNRPTRSNSETGGKLRHYRVFKTEPSRRVMSLHRLGLANGGLWPPCGRGDCPWLWRLGGTGFPRYHLTRGHVKFVIRIALKTNFILLLSVLPYKD